MILEPIQYVLGLLSGGLVGFTLGLVGGGGSILAVPLMVYLVGVPNPHIAIGTSAFAVAANAAAGVINHARNGTVKWPCALIYASAGVVGAFAGSTIGKSFDGQKLLFLFAIVMVLVGVLMLRGRRDPGNPDAQCNRKNAPKVLSFGLGTGMFSGFFGIGGGLLIVPGLVASTGMPILNAVGSSLVCVTAFGLTTALNYAYSSLIDWPLALLFILGGLFGSFGGALTAKKMAGTTGRLSTVFSILIFSVAAYMLWKSAGVLL